MIEVYLSRGTLWAYTCKHLTEVVHSRNSACRTSGNDVAQTLYGYFLNPYQVDTQGGTMVDVGYQVEFLQDPVASTLLY